MATTLSMLACEQSAQQTIIEWTLDTSEFGKVTVSGNAQSTDRLVIMFTAAGTPSVEEAEVVQKANALGKVVAVIDSSETSVRLDKQRPGDDCVDIAGPLEWVSQQIQHRFAFKHYDPPILIGHRLGASFVYSALAQAQPLAFLEGLSVDFQPGLPLHRPLCQMQTHRVATGQRFEAGQKLRVPWTVAGTVAIAEDVRHFKVRSDQLNVGMKNINSQFVVGSLSNIYIQAMQGSTTAVTNDGSVSDLPLVEVASPVDHKPLVLIVSGDGGWRDIDQELGRLLAERGYGVVGFDALRYFWAQREVDATARDVDKTIKHYQSVWSTEATVLVGYSFGADILPFVYNRLSNRSRSSVVMLSLLAAESTAEFEIDIFEWVGSGRHRNLLPVLPEIRSIDPGRVQCIHGVEESDSLCTLSELPSKIEVVARPGRHHFDGDYAAIADLIERGIQRRLVVSQ